MVRRLSVPPGVQEPARSPASAVHGVRQGRDRRAGQDGGTDLHRAGSRARLSTVLDRFVLEKAPGPLVDIDPSLARARSAFGGLVDTLAAMRDEQLTYQWMWGEHQADIRYGFYRVLEMLEGATAAARLALARQPSSEARDAVGAATAARWGLHGVLATLNDADLDADAAGGEWTIRRTMGHIINSQRGYAWGSAYWISVRDEPRNAGPQRAPDDAFGSDFPEEEDEPTGSLAQVRR